MKQLQISKEHFALLVKINLCQMCWLKCPNRNLVTLREQLAVIAKQKCLKQMLQFFKPTPVPGIMVACVYCNCVDPKMQTVDELFSPYCVSDAHCTEHLGKRSLAKFFSHECMVQFQANPAQWARFPVATIQYNNLIDSTLVYKKYLVFGMNLNGNILITLF